MALSQCLDDSPARWPSSKQGNDLNLQELYNEKHRLALEELVSGGVDNFMELLRKESIPNFLSDEEIRSIGRAAVVPRCLFPHGEDTLLEQSVCSSMDCSSVTYFPEISDVEPPLLEIGWPAFTTGSFRGVTRAVAHFQPSYGECIYSCKEAARRMIKSAKEVIAIVADSLTDLDIFKDLQDACVQRKVPVYLLLDQTCAPAFLKMCSNIGVRLDELQQMRVRTITGGTYFMRSGARITGKVHERFMLIDGNRVATGSYRFNWTDGKLNSSNLIELSGQITENFDEEFRVLYAQSTPVASARNSGLFDHLLVKRPATPQRPGAESVCLTSTPSRPWGASAAKAGKLELKFHPRSDTIGDDWTEQRKVLEGLSASPAQRQPSGEPAARPEAEAPVDTLRHVSTQTSCPEAADLAVQTDPEPSLLNAALPRRADDDAAPAAPRTASASAAERGAVPSSSEPGSSSSSSSSSSPTCGTARHPPVRTAPPGGDPRDCFHKLAKERQYHYSSIRAKLEYMMAVLSHRHELADLTNVALGPGPHRGHDDGGGLGTWPRARCLR